ncbi:hypothetical protein HOLleu_14549 [Holothuria leucospilota]|uniref:Uncharacterized protein n=1 Tax=Holothuria leucospilota TaxID=206669 RepID=A0A9Q1C8R9_HOLLE|nr:hypothetical protein HOLleu_14549 [Holothuria leucospilota]
MSLQRGNHKKRGQKYQNTTAFKNDLHDRSGKTKAMNSMVISEVCARCKDVIQWKIQYKKYKPLSQPKKCTKCLQKTVKAAYHVICSKCAKENGVCAKCGGKEDIVHKPVLSPAERASQETRLQGELKVMSERQRRTFYRTLEKDEDADDEEEEGDGDECRSDSEIEEGTDDENGNAG